MNSPDQTILSTALEAAAAAWRTWGKDKSLMELYPPPQDILDTLALEIRAWPVFQAVEGKSIYSGNAGFVLHADSLAGPLLLRALSPGAGTTTIPEAVKWLDKVLTTQKAKGRFVAAIWGITIDQRVKVSADTFLIPFDQLPDTTMKRRILDQSKSLWQDAAWLGQRYFDKPGAAIIRDVRQFPYFGRPDLSAKKVFELEADVDTTIACLEAVFTRLPLVAASWFEYQDQDLDINAYENYQTWHVPEVEPYIYSTTTVDSERVQAEVPAFYALNGEWRDKILRSIDRFTLSQCRRNLPDKIVDLTLAFEILAGAERRQAPIGWLVSLRGAQLIGGALEQRKALRDKIAKIYSLRNSAAHGGRLKANDAKELEKAFNEAAEVYAQLMGRCLSSKAQPDWDTIELSPTS